MARASVTIRRRQYCRDLALQRLLTGRLNESKPIYIWRPPGQSHEGSPSDTKPFQRGYFLYLFKYFLTFFVSQMSYPCPLCLRTQWQQVRNTAEPSYEVVAEEQRLLSILQQLIDMTRNRQLGSSLAREVNAVRAILREARRQGGLDSILAVVSSLEVPIQVRLTGRRCITSI